MIERGYRTITDELTKIKDDQIKNLSIIFWVNRSTVTRKTERISFYLNYEREPVLPIKLDIPTQRILSQNNISDTAGLLALRAKQIQQRDEDFKKAAFHLQRVRKEGKNNFDKNYVIRQTTIIVGDLILLHDTRRKGDISTILKLALRWLDLYRIQQTNQKKGTYLLKELDGTLLYNTFLGNRLKKFVIREYYVYEINKSQGTASSKKEKKENLSDNNN